MAGNLTAQVRNIAEVTTAVARGDLSRKITVDVKGEILELKNTINTMVRSAQRLRVGSHARRQGGRHRRQARRPGPGARGRRHLEGPHRQRELHGVEPDRTGPHIAEVATAIAGGDLSKKITGRRARRDIACSRKP